ncbi:MAG: response regulator [Promethearchaeota archaeon]|jgi:DNA-binding response OmpR family regulator
MTPEQKKTDVIIIEDDIDTQLLLKHYFEVKGVSCKCAGSFKKGRELLKQTIPTIMLVDILLPDKKGDELCKIVRSDPMHKDAMIYFLTAIPRQDALKIMEQYKADGVISKPFNLDEIDDLVNLIKGG